MRKLSILKVYKYSNSRQKLLSFKQHSKSHKKKNNSLVGDYKKRKKDLHKNSNNCLISNHNTLKNSIMYKNKICHQQEL